MTQKFSRFLSEATIIIVAFLLTVTIRLLQWTPIDFARVLSLMPKRVKEYWLLSNVENVEEKAYEYDYAQDCLGHVTHVDQYELNEYLDGAARLMIASIRLMGQSKFMRSIIDANQREQRHGLA
jgi:hypothetical protein